MARRTLLSGLGDLGGWHRISSYRRCVPDFGTYVEKGTRAGLPYTDGKLHFTASQSRHWTEHSVVILEKLFERKVPTPTPGPCCCPVPTLCPCLLPALPPMPVCE